VNKSYLIIGASAAGIGCALRLRMLDQDANITVLTAEPVLPYNKCFMADALIGDKEISALDFCTESVLAEKNITFVRSAQVVALDYKNKSVLCADGRRFQYDALCIAVGKKPRMLPLFKDAQLNNLFSFYYKNDLLKILDHIKTDKPCRAIVIGAGLTGLEAADGLRARGLAVMVVERSAHVLPALINEKVAAVIAAHMSAHNVDLITQDIITGYETDGDRITALHTANGLSLPTDLVVCAIGAEPNTAWLPDEIKTVNGYCNIDAHMCTSISAVYAAGDCCMVYDRVSGEYVPNALWSDAMQQGSYAAYGMCGIEKLYSGAVMIAASSFFGIKVAITGVPQYVTGMQIREVEGPGWYHQLVYEGGALRGFMLIGNTTELARYRRELVMC